MAVYIDLRSLRSQQLEEFIRHIAPVPGTCIFFDMVNSTGIKYDLPFAEWVNRLKKTLDFITFLNNFSTHILKIIGDEIMAFIPDSDLLQQGTTGTPHRELLEDIFATADNLRNHPLEGNFMACKVAIHHCTESYNITFLKGHDDYYGKDIDMTARLMTLSRDKRIVISEAFFRKALGILRPSPATNLPGCLQEVSRKKTARFKGIPDPVAYRTLALS